MAHREAAARRVLPKTGIETIDAEAVVVQSCLGRIQDTIAADTRERLRKRGVTRVIPAPATRLSSLTATRSELPDHAEAVDVSTRTEMGIAREEADVDDNETLPERTDAVVAQSALLRLMRFMANIGDTVSAATDAAEVAKSKAKALEERVQLLEAENAEMAAKLAVREDPADAFHKYRTLWLKQHADQQGTLAATLEERRAVIQNLLEKRSANAAARKVVRERRKVLEARAAEDASRPNAAQEDREIDAMLQGFAPLPASVKSDITSVPNFALRSMGTMRALGSMGGTSMLSLPTPTASRRVSLAEERIRFSELEADATFGNLVPSPADAGKPPRSARRRSGGVDASASATPAGSARTGSPAGSDSAKSDSAASETDSDTSDGSGVSAAERVMDNMNLLLEGDDAKFLKAMDPNASSNSDDASTGSDADDGLDENASLNVPSGDGTTVAGGSKKGRGGRRKTKAAVRADELVITRILGTRDRTVARMDPTATYIGVLLGALRYAPSEYTVLELDTEAMAGRRAALARQAQMAGIASFWDEVANCTAPIVTIAQCNPPRGMLVDDKVIVPQAHVSVLSERYALSHFDHKAAHTAQDQVTNRVVSDYRGGQDTVTRPQRLPAQEPRAEVRTQHPGILSVLSRGAVAGERIDLISAGMVRCYASSMQPSCKVDALITPFFDIHSPYFSTRDAPGQFVIVAFDNIAITPMGYSFACTHPTSGGFYPRSWVFEGSLDGYSWTVLRTHDGDETLNRYTPVGTWIVRAKAETYFSQFRIRQTGPNASSTRHLTCCSFEVYGRAMYVRERKPIDAVHLPPVPRSFQSTTPGVDTSPLRNRSLPSRAQLKFTLFDELPPEPVAKAKKKGARRK